MCRCKQRIGTHRLQRPLLIESPSSPLSSIDGLDFLGDADAADWAQVELFCALHAAAVVSTGDERAVHLVVEAHLGKKRKSTARRELGGDNACGTYLFCLPLKRTTA